MAKITTLQKPFYIHSESNMYLAFLDGKQCQTIDQFHIKIAEAFQFPDYYGQNLDALEEMLNDLEWINQDYIILIIQRSHLWLSDDDELKADILQILSDVSSKSFEIILK